MVPWLLWAGYGLDLGFIGRTIIDLTLNLLAKHLSVSSHLYL